MSFGNAIIKKGFNKFPSIGGVPQAGWVLLYSEHPPREREDERRRTMPCEIRPIAVDTPQTAKGDTFFSYSMGFDIMY